LDWDRFNLQFGADGGNWQEVQKTGRWFPALEAHTCQRLVEVSDEGKGRKGRIGVWNSVKKSKNSMKGKSGPPLATSKNTSGRPPGS
jgi:hypothetical protein